MSDLERKTVEELRDDLTYEVSVEGVINSDAMRVFDELARRLEEAQQKRVVKIKGDEFLASQIDQAADRIADLEYQLSAKDREIERLNECIRRYQLDR